MKFSIKSIDLENFRQYRGKHEISFNFDSDKNVVIILGRNGAGKSNLLNALTWCFYGIESHISNSNQESMPIINTSALKELTAGETVNAEVVVSLETDMGPWTIRRTISGGKDASGEEFVNKESKLYVSYSSGGQDLVVIGDETQVLINNLLPEALRTFFFMDGEKLREFFNEDSSENIVESVEKVSQLDLMYKAADNLELYEKELRRSVKDSTPKLDEINGRIDKYTKEIELNEKRHKALRDSLKLNNDELKTISDYLVKSGIQHVEALELENNTLKDSMDLLKTDLKKRVEERNQYLVKIAPFIYLKKSLEKTLEVVESKVQKGELPSRIKANFVRELIEKGECICGNPVEGSAKIELEKYAKKLILSDLSEVCVIGKTTIKEILEDIKDYPHKMDGYYKSIDEIQFKIDKNALRMKMISDDLQKCENKEQIILKEKRRKQLYTINGQIEQNIKFIQSDLTVYKEELKIEKEAYTNELSTIERNNELNLKLKLVQDALKTLAKSEVIIKDKIRKQIETVTQNNFFLLIRKTGAFKSVTINDKYEVCVVHSSGYNVIEHLSAGEYMILGISFMSALMTISGFKAPVIIDTPLGKIDDKHRDKITKELPVFLKGTQLILLVTPTEYDDTVSKNLHKFLIEGNEYEIKENAKQDESVVVKK